MTCGPRVTLREAATRVTVQTIAPRRVVLDVATLATIADQRPALRLTSAATPVRVREQPTRVQLGTLGLQGVPGPAGLPADATLTRPAARVLGGHRAVLVTDAGTFDTASASTLARLPIGITTGAAVQGEEVSAQVFGVLAEPGWQWQPGGDVFLGEDGALTQSPSGTAALLVLGRALSATELFIDIDLPLMR